MLVEDSCTLLQKSLSVFFPVLVHLHSGWQHNGLETGYLLKARKGAFLPNYIHVIFFSYICRDGELFFSNICVALRSL